MSDLIHIVCLDAPSPPDYGGAIDMFYKVRALGEAGKKIILHYFNYNASRHANGLEQYCAEIHAYERKGFAASLPLGSPHIVSSRINRQLIERLNKDSNPVLLEGLHCAGILPQLTKKERVILRMHNEESSYYNHLAKTEKNVVKKLYFRRESQLLERLQEGLDKSVKLACLSETDMERFSKHYRFHDLFFLPCFIPWQQVTSQPGAGTYCLYHGNLSVSENEEAALWLIAKVFSQTAAPLVIAGKGISNKLISLAKKFSNIKLINNPPIDEIDSLVRDAHINVLPSLNRTGVKLKLLNALLNGRFCITNQQGVMGSRINNGLTVVDSPSEWQLAIESLLEQAFCPAHITERNQVLSIYNNRENALALSEQWKHCQ